MNELEKAIWGIPKATDEEAAYFLKGYEAMKKLLKGGNT